MSRLNALTLLIVVFACEVTAQPSLFLSKSSVDLGIARIGKDVSDSVLITNVGAADLVVDVVGLSTTAFSLPAFSVTPSLTLTPGQTMPLAVQFHPPLAGAFLDTVLIGQGSWTLVIPITGTGVRSTVVINEILADPPTSKAGDANLDGIRNTFQDEFVEILNIGPRPEVIQGWRLSDDDSEISGQFAFPEGTVLGPGGRAVLFGGGTPTGIEGPVFVDDGRIGNGLTNSGDAVLLIDPSGPDTLDSVSYSSEGDQDQSLVRCPEGTGEFHLHGRLPGDGARFSPGQRRVALSSLQLAPQDTVIVVGGSLAWRVTGLFPDGRVRVLTDEVVWTVMDTILLRLVQGMGTAIREGTTQLKVSLGELVSPPARLVVKSPELTSLSLAPVETTVVIGGEVRYRAEGRASDGTLRVIASGLTWAAADTGSISPTEDGTFRAIRPVETTVSATDGRIFSPPAVLRVVRMGDLDANGSVEVSDALRLIDLILEVRPEATHLEVSAGDLNNDAIIDVADLSAIIDVLLGRHAAGKVALRSAREGTMIATYETRHVLDVDRSEILLSTAEEVSALQIELEGCQDRVDLTGRASEMEAAIRERANGKSRVLIYSLSGHTIPAGSGAILQVGNCVRVKRVLVAGPRMLTEAGGLATGGSGSQVGRVGAYSLRQSFPNPANGAVLIGYDLPEDSDVTLEVFDLHGRRIVKLLGEWRQAGRHQLSWAGRDQLGRIVGSGVYLYRLKAGRFVSTRKMIWLK